MLRKKLTLADVFALSVGAMVGSGIFILPGLAYAQAGPAFLVSYLLAGLLAVSGLLSQAELISAMPRAGGTYFYVMRSLGPGVGTVDGLLTWLSFSLKSAFAILGMATVLKAVLPGPVEVWAVGLCWVFVGLNLLGAKQAGRTQVVIVAVILASMVLYVSRGLPSVRLDNLIPFAPRGVGALVSTAALIFISYGGLLKVAGVAEEVQNPAKNLPLGMMLSLSAVLVLYILVALVTAGLVPPSRLAGALTPLSDGARLLGGTGAGVVMSVVALLALFSAANAGIMASTRYPLALARDGLLPPALARVSERFRTPHVSLLVTGAVMAGAVLIRLTTLVKAASTVFIFIYAFSCLSVVILRESRLQNYQPRFSAPLYPLFQVMAFLAMGSSSRPLVAKHFWWALPPRRGRYPSTGSTGVSGPARSMLFSISSNA